MIAALHKPVYRGCFTLIYAYGLRITEAVTLPVTAFDSKQMVLRIIGKRNKERALPLTESILDVLREVWKTRRSKRWLFASRRIVTHLPGVEFLRRFLQHVLPRGFHKVRYYGLWHPSRRHLASRAWLLRILQKPTDADGPLKIADLLEALSA
ncbi:MAG TPA: tyrosine-type recombinase/integrase, partial [Thermoguttaceae bacterium]|nr:tyrosine-type recombinase/integrase [Thermoguttaceae bacterium]